MEDLVDPGSFVEYEPDQTRLRELVPERQRRAYAVEPIVETLADEGSVTFLRERFAPELVTALARIEGRPLGFIANDTRHRAGAITSDAADKAARFMQLCDAFGLPVVSLVDTPGMMVEPEAEATGPVRHTSRLLVAGAALRVPFIAVILRRAYGSPEPSGQTYAPIGNTLRLEGGNCQHHPGSRLAMEAVRQA